MHVHTHAHVKVRRQFLEALSFHHVVAGDQTQVVKLGGKHLHRLSCFTGPKQILLFALAYKWRY